MSYLPGSYYSLAANPASDVLSLVFIHLPFSLWHAFSIMTAWVAGFAAFTHGGHGRHPSLIVKILVIISLVLWALLAVGYAFRTRRGDIAGALVLVFALYGVFDHQRNPLIHYFALAAFIVSALAAVKSLYFHFTSRDGAISLGNDERSPLVA